jgi:hypothetical protein
MAPLQDTTKKNISSFWFFITAFKFFSFNVHLAHWQADQLNPQTQACQRANFSPSARQ